MGVEGIHEKEVILLSLLEGYCPKIQVLNHLVGGVWVGSLVSVTLEVLDVLEYVTNFRSYATYCEFLMA